MSSRPSQFRALGAHDAASVGDLKAAAPSLTADPAELAALRRRIGNRPIWIAGSTHAGEEEIVAAAHVRAAREHPGLLTIIAPRHPARGEAIAQTLRHEGLKIARRSRGETLSGETDVYLADTLGDLGLLFRVAEIAFIGGSLVAKGGHNPFEAARLGCAVLHGDDMSNCAGMAAALDRAGAALTVFDAESLGETVARLLGNPGERRARAKAATQVAAAGSDILDKVFFRLAPFLDGLAPAAQHAGPPGVPQVRHGRLQIAAEDAHP